MAFIIKMLVSVPKGKYQRAYSKQKKEGIIHMNIITWLKKERDVEHSIRNSWYDYKYP